MKSIQKFSLKPGEVISQKYKILKRVGSGLESEVYLVKEIKTGIERAIKMYFPHRNKKNKTLKFGARKMHKLRNCNILVQYHNHDTFFWKGHQIDYLVSEFVEGEMLSDFVKKLPGKHMQPFQALHLLHALISGLEQLHKKKEYHGDIHTENIMVLRQGLTFELKLIDFYNWGPSKKEHMDDDIHQAIKVFYEILGGNKYYARQPQIVKDICLGCKKGLILSRYKNATKLREFMENVKW